MFKTRSKRLPFISLSAANRIGYTICGFSSVFSYIFMLSAAFDLIRRSEMQMKLQSNPESANKTNQTVSDDANSLLSSNSNATHCNSHSTSLILLVDTVPMLTIKLLYPILLVGCPLKLKVLATAFFSAASFIITGFAWSPTLLYLGVTSAALNIGLGETIYLSNAYRFGDAAIEGYSIGTGMAAVVGSTSYATLSMSLSIESIMLLMLIVPVAMLLSFFCLLEPVDERDRTGSGQLQLEMDKKEENNLELQSGGYQLADKLRQLPSLSQYFLPLLLVYFAEYYINQGLFELIYFAEAGIDHAAQYRWFQVCYQLGVLISRSSIVLFRIRFIWAMSLLQALNAVVFLAHVLKFIHIPGFAITLAIIIYEGLLGGFTYTNTFYRMQSEMPRGVREVAISIVSCADSMGIVLAGLVAMRTFRPLCSLYEPS